MVDVCESEVNVTIQNKYMLGDFTFNKYTITSASSIQQQHFSAQNSSVPKYMLQKP